MLKLKNIPRAVRIAITRLLRRIPPPADAAAQPQPRPGDGMGLTTEGVFGKLVQMRRMLGAVVIVGGAGAILYAHPPIATAQRGELGLRTNQLTGTVTQWQDGTVLALPVLHDVQIFSLRDRLYRPQQIVRADGQAPLQSVEGLSVGVDLVVRYALDPRRIATTARAMPGDPAELVEPAVQGTIYKVFARYTVREIFSTKRVEIQQALEAELKPKLANDGVVLRGVLVGKIDLPADYKRGMEGLLAEELATQKMQYTLELKDKRVKETELEAAAEKVRREVRAEAAAREQVIAARAQEEAMKHVLPFKQRQIEQRQLEAEAEKQARLKTAEASAQARRIEANGEADARRKLAEAEAFRMERVGQANAEQMAREGALISRHPLLIQKALADKLSDKVQVIIAPPGSGGGFVAANLLGGGVGREGMQHAASREAADDKE